MNLNLKFAIGEEAFILASSKIRKVTIVGILVDRHNQVYYSVEPACLSAYIEQAQCFRTRDELYNYLID